MYSALLVFVGGGIGSVLRFLISKITLKLYSGSFPMGTFLANIISCAVLAIVLLFISQKQTLLYFNSYRMFLIVGFCGGLSTFSTFSFETFELMKNNMWGVAFLNIGLSLVLGILVMFVFFNKSSVFN